ncbi:AraC family transcriptional regulator [Streptomyces sp. NPDC048430]|uniref:AraC family transcriptional regulator n=1 Tax=Streptomyces sp. NPDC048430 TaxID=3155388 RepID=UPI0034291D7E
MRTSAVNATSSATTRRDVIRTRDIRTAQSLISAALSPHVLTIAGHDEDFDVTMQIRRSGSVTLDELRHGTEVIIDAGRLDSYYSINVVRSGRATFRCGDQQLESRPGTAAVLNPAERTTMWWSADCLQAGMTVSRAMVDRTIESILGHPPDETVRFKIAFDLSSQAGGAWARGLSLLRDSIDMGAPELVLRPLEELVVSQLLTAQPHNYTGRLEGDPRPVRSRGLSHVLDAIDSDPAAALTPADMAKIANTSVRSLQVAFSEQLGVSPMRYLRRVRLARAHQELLQSQPSDGRTVADIAFKWGFGHVPRFAGIYRDQYGELPSVTLRS